MTREERERRILKALLFGELYGMGAARKREYGERPLKGKEMTVIVYERDDAENSADIREPKE